MSDRKICKHGWGRVLKYRGPIFIIALEITRKKARVKISIIITKLEKAVSCLCVMLLTEEMEHTILTVAICFVPSEMSSIEPQQWVHVLCEQKTLATAC